MHHIVHTTCNMHHIVHTTCNMHHIYASLNTKIEYIHLILTNTSLQHLFPETCF
ncbi:uncharacterized protein LOC124265166 [Haliotis rubra]|uniref:uncharacterized protein LOC124265166 n=1 Tax=Haliotis rubra TaxID=36100 RepID=UPI001EE4F852|nr:uncharacterized protein LOC124265166 [Haliotis rubra]